MSILRMATFAGCLHARVGHDSPARNMSQDLLKYVYKLLKQHYYEPIEERYREISNMFG
jgi:hypothetical protein